MVLISDISRFEAICKHNEYFSKGPKVKQRLPMSPYIYSHKLAPFYVVF